jgi:hypothetical protein
LAEAKKQDLQVDEFSDKKNGGKMPNQLMKT